MTALSLQAEHLQESDLSAQARERLDTLRQGIRRSQNLVVQLLALARAHDKPAASKQAVSVQKVFRRVLEDLMPLAERKQIDIGVSGADDVLVAASEMDIGTWVKNLADNAIRYTPKLGRIDLSVYSEGDKAVLQISDTEAGIAQQERAREFEPVYRMLGTGDTGSGLGLSIVKAIADRIQAQVQFSETDEIAHTGLRVQVTVPTRSQRQ